jgi:hypothetical protein
LFEQERIARHRYVFSSQIFYGYLIMKRSGTPDLYSIIEYPNLYL